MNARGAIIAAALLASPAAHAGVSFTVWLRGHAPDVAPVTMAAIMRRESGFDRFAIHVNVRAKLPRQPRNEREAIETAEWLQAHSINFDAGLMQINVGNWRWLGLTAETVFRPEVNVRAADRVLEACYQRAAAISGPGQKALGDALSCYNTGNLKTGYVNHYVTSVSEVATLPVPALLPWHGAATGAAGAKKQRKTPEARSDNTAPWFAAMAPQSHTDSETDNGGWFAPVQ